MVGAGYQGHGNWDVQQATDGAEIHSRRRTQRRGSTIIEEWNQHGKEKRYRPDEASSRWSAVNLFAFLAFISNSFLDEEAFSSLYCRMDSPVQLAERQAARRAALGWDT